MKGTFFQKPLELNLQVEGETWRQGDAVRGTLLIRNRGSGPADLGGIAVTLAYGELRKVHAKSPEAFENLGAAPFTASTSLAPGQEASMAWTFETERNCPITDTSRSLFLLYGQGSASEKVGQLQLMVQPFWVIQEIVELVRVGFRFVVKTWKSSKGWVEVKLSPPDSKAFAGLEQMFLLFRFEGERLGMQYRFQIKKMQASAAGIEVKKEKLQSEREYGPEQYRTPSGRFDHESMEAAVREALGQADFKLI